ncbi:MAG: hypothetical protein ACTSWY_15855 [Promethearchaeota archaeon]
MKKFLDKSVDRTNEINHSKKTEYIQKIGKKPNFEKEHYEKDGEKNTKRLKKNTKKIKIKESTVQLKPNNVIHKTDLTDSKEGIINKLNTLEIKINVITDYICNKENYPSKLVGLQKKNKKKFVRVLNNPPIEKIIALKRTEHRIDWYKVIVLAKKYGWFQNIYTFTRFLEILDEILEKNDFNPRNYKQKWNRLNNKAIYVTNEAKKWKNHSIKRLGQTQKDIIDSISHFNNEEKTSLEIFNYLKSIKHEKYCKKNDLRRLRNTISKLVVGNYIEKLKGKDKCWYFSLKSQ